jgi:hypothetical protein
MLIDGNKIGVAGDFAFEGLRAMSYSSTKGGEAGECIQTLGRIRDGDFEGWIREWSAVADRNASDAERYLARGLPASACAAFHRASNYYRTAEMFATREDPRQLELWKKSRACFAEAARLNDPAVEPISIPYLGSSLPGYLVKVPGGERAPTLIAHSGYDGSAEELYHMIGAAAPAHGWNCLIFEGPGQRGALHLDPSLTLRHDWEVPVKAVVDFALTRPEVDPGRLAIVGYSLGGYLAPRACAFEHRIKACVASSLLTDIGEAFRSVYPKILRRRERTFNFLFKLLMRFQKDMRWGFEHGQWVIGPTTPLEFIKFWDDFSLEGLQDKIECPIVSILGADEIRLTSEAVIDRMRAWLGGMNVQYHLFDQASGGAAHCQMGNMSLAHAVIFDWLDRTVLEGEEGCFPLLRDIDMGMVRQLRKRSR